MLKKGSFDHVIIETSGLADPGPLINMFWLDEVFQDKLYFDGVVCVVDCKNFHRQQMLGEFIRQISYANVVLLNKTDLLSENSVQDACLEITNFIRFVCLIFNYSL